MAPRIRFVTQVVAVPAVLAPSHAIAQEAASSFSELASRLKAGDVIRVSVGGNATVRATVEKLSPSSIEIAPVGKWRAGTDRRICLNKTCVRFNSIAPTPSGTERWSGSPSGALQA